MFVNKRFANFTRKNSKIPRVKNAKFPGQYFYINTEMQVDFQICISVPLNSITVHNFAKLSLLIAYNLVHSFDIICLSERYLNSETPPNDTRLELPGYNLLRSDHPSNNKRGDVCVYYKSTLPLRILNISNLDECINFEVSIANKICRFIHLYRSPSQKQDEFQEFKSNLEINLDALSANILSLQL